VFFIIYLLKLTICKTQNNPVYEIDFDPIMREKGYDGWGERKKMQDGRCVVEWVLEN
jgi:hypothetical protein